MLLLNRYDQHGQTASFLTHDTGAPFLGDSVERLTVDEVEARGLGTHGQSAHQGRPRTTKLTRHQTSCVATTDKPDYFNLKATISFVKTDRLSYPAHGVGKCMKRVLPDGGTWQCGTCGVEVDEPQHRYVLHSTLDCARAPLGCGADPPSELLFLRRYLLNLAAEDYTTRIWLTAFDEVGRILLGLSAGEVEEMLVCPDSLLSSFTARRRVSFSRLKSRLTLIQSRTQADDPAALKDLIVSRCHGQTYLFRCAAKTSTFQVGHPHLSHHHPFPSLPAPPLDHTHLIRS